MVLFQDPRLVQVKMTNFVRNRLNRIFRIWLSLEELLVQTCWMDNLQVTYNPSNDTYSNTNGVEFRGLGKFILILQLF